MQKEGSYSKVFDEMVKLSKEYELLDFNMINNSKLLDTTRTTFNEVDDEQTITMNLMQVWYPSLYSAVHYLGISWPWDLDLEVKSIMTKAGFEFEENDD